MKKRWLFAAILALVFAACMAVFAACGGNGGDGNSNGNGNQNGNGNSNGNGGTDITDPGLIDGSQLQGIAVSQSGTLSWSRLKIASKYLLTVTLADGEHTYELGKEVGSLDLTALSDGAALGYGKNSLTLTVFEWQEEEIEGETIGGDVPVDSDSFFVISRYSGYSLDRLGYADEYVEMDGFYSSPRTDENGTYYLSEQIMEDANEEMRYNVSKSVKAKEGSSVQFYKSREDRAAEQNAIGGFDFNIEAIGHGDNFYYARAKDAAGAAHDYDLLIRGVAYRRISVVQGNRITNNDGFSETTYTTLNFSQTVLEGDLFDINAVYEKAGILGNIYVLRDGDFNLYEADTDCYAPVSWSESITLYADDIAWTGDMLDAFEEYGADYTLAFTPASAANGQPDRVELTYNKGTAENTDVVIPGNINGAKVVLDEFSFYNAEITSAVFGEGTREIPDKVFFLCDSLERVIIPKGVTYVGRDIFSGNVKDKLTIFCMGSKEDTKNWNPSWNSSFTSTFKTVYDAGTYESGNVRYTLDVAKMTASAYALAGFGGTFPAEVRYEALSAQPFAVTRITYVEEPSLTSLTVPVSVTEISQGAFAQCQNLQSITLPFVGGAPELTLDNRDDFDYIFGSGNVPQSLQTVILTGDAPIGEFAFSGCTNLKYLEIQGNVPEIGNGAFGACVFESVKVSAQNEYFESVGDHYLLGKDGTLYYSCDGSLPSSGITVIAGGAFYYREDVTSVSVPAGVKYIGANAFCGCSALASVALPEGVERIGENAFAETAYANNAANKENGVLYIGNYLIWADYNYEFDPASCVRAGTVLIADGAFQYMNLTGDTLILPESVRYIGSEAFRGVDFAAVVATGAEVIGDRAFFTDNFSYIVLGDGLKEIGEEFFRYFFRGCYFYEGTAQQWENVEIAFYNNYMSSLDSLLYFYSESAPQGEGNYWHYVNGEPVQWQ